MISRTNNISRKTVHTSWRKCLLVSGNPVDRVLKSGKLFLEKGFVFSKTYSIISGILVDKRQILVRKMVLIF